MRVEETANELRWLSITFRSYNIYGETFPLPFSFPDIGGNFPRFLGLFHPRKMTAFVMKSVDGFPCMAPSDYNLHADKVRRGPAFKKSLLCYGCACYIEK